MRIDIDIEGLEAINDPEIRDILRRFSRDGFAVFGSDKVNRQISRASASLRERKLIITSNDRRANLNVLSVNNNIMNAEKLISEGWKDIIKELK